MGARLREIYGADVDPRVELSPNTVPDSHTQRQASGVQHSAGVLSRLSERGASASRYRLDGEIARGGMGAILQVFDEDLRRRLAMKVILDHRTGEAGVDTKHVHPALLARFLEEAQVTGQLDHPGIVPVHELGLDERGQAYFTMRLVQGRDLEAIFELAASGRDEWSQTRALGVLLKVCEAMAYAHAKGVVHRDLKPANVMVGQFGEVYVMDWGLARVSQQADRHDLRIRLPENADTATKTAAARSTPRSAASAAETGLHSLPGVETDRREASALGSGDALLTMDGSVVGTPCYMPPEQARGQVGQLDERADVYAVGAMLYRLLCGAAPFMQRGEAAAPTTILLRVLNGPPVPLEDLARDTPAELAAICAKAMARDPSERYANMLALADDLRAFLEGRVVKAYEVGALAEARKWVRRNRPLSAALAAAVLILVVGLVASLVFADRAEDSALLAEERRFEADANADRARRQALIAGEANDFLNNDLLASIAPEHEGIDVTVREVLDHAAARLELRFTDEPEVEAALRMTIGTSYSRIGEYRGARKHLERALELRKTHAGPRAESTLESMNNVAAVWAELGLSAEAIALYEEAITLAREILGQEARGTLSMTNDLAIVYGDIGRLREARQLYEAILPIEERVHGENDQGTLSTVNNLALLDQREGLFEPARAKLQRVFERRLAAEGERHPETLIAMSNLATVLGDMGHFAAAEELSRRALGLRREVQGPRHPMVAQELGNLGNVVSGLGRFGEARALISEGLEICIERFGPDHALTLLAQHNLASTLQSLGRNRESLEMEQGVLAARRRVLGDKHVDTLGSMGTIALALRALGRLDESEALLLEALALNREVLGVDHPSTLICNENLGNVYFTQGKQAEAEAIVREVLEARERVLGDGHPDVAKTTFNLAMVLKAQGKTSDALDTVREALELNRAALGDIHVQVASCLQTLGDLEFQSGDRAAASLAYAESLEVRGALGLEDEESGYLQHQLGVLHYEDKDFAAALPAFELAVAMRRRLVGVDLAGLRVSLFLQARTLLALRRFEEAEPVALELRTAAARAGAAGAEHLTRARQLLLQLYGDWGKPEEAAKWR